MVGFLRSIIIGITEAHSDTGRIPLLFALESSSVDCFALQMAPSWTWKADYNYYGYGEGSPIGPTAPRSFRGNVYTLAVNYAF